MNEKDYLEDREETGNKHIPVTEEESENWEDRKLDEIIEE